MVTQVILSIVVGDMPIVVVLNWENKNMFTIYRKCAFNVSVISLLTVLLVEETTDLSQFTDKSYHLALNRIHPATNRVRTHNFRSDMH